MRDQRRNGFTLIELMITIAILAILILAIRVAIAIPSLFHLKDKATWDLAQANLNSLRASLVHYNADSEKNIYPADATSTLDELRVLLPQAYLPQEADLLGWDESMVTYTPGAGLQTFIVRVKVGYRYDDILVATPSGITPVRYPR